MTPTRLDEAPLVVELRARAAAATDVRDLRALVCELQRALCALVGGVRFYEPPPLTRDAYWRRAHHELVHRLIAEPARHDRPDYELTGGARTRCEEAHVEALEDAHLRWLCPSPPALREFASNDERALVDRLTAPHDAALVANLTRAGYLVDGVPVLRQRADGEPLCEHDECRGVPRSTDTRAGAHVRLDCGIEVFP